MLYHLRCLTEVQVEEYTSRHFTPIKIPRVQELLKRDKVNCMKFC